MTKSKTCIACLKHKPVSQFCKDSGYKDGYRGDCNACRNEARRGFLKQEEVLPDGDGRLFGIPDLNRAAPRRLPSLGVNPSYDLKYRPVTQPEWLTNREDLPDPKYLPAAYLKRCADYWTDLLGDNENTTTRIA